MNFFKKLFKKNVSRKYTKLNRLLRKKLIIAEGEYKANKRYIKEFKHNEKVLKNMFNKITDDINKTKEIEKYIETYENNNEWAKMKDVLKEYEWAFNIAESSRNNVEALVSLRDQYFNGDEYALDQAIRRYKWERGDGK